MKKCCNPKKTSCESTDLREAIKHAQERADASGKTQGTVWKDGKWVTTSK